jgi:type IV secretory pathway VirJ component
MKALPILLWLGLTSAHAAGVSDLPLNEVPATSGTSQTFALFLTGDGGWASLDRGVAAQFAAKGISTVGFDSRSYFWHARTPGETAADVARVLRHYLAAWNKSQILLVGYSFGADVLPFVVNRLPPELRSRLVALTLLGVETTASFEVHVADWLPGVASRGAALEPEMLTLGKLPVQCIYGAGERGTLCPHLDATRVTVERIGDGHHFGRDYTLIADRILAFAQAKH